MIRHRHDTPMGRIPFTAAEAFSWLGEFGGDGRPDKDAPWWGSPPGALFLAFFLATLAPFLLAESLIRLVLDAPNRG
jgi:hypothetical protein